VKEEDFFATSKGIAMVTLGLVGIGFVIGFLLGKVIS